MQPKKKLSNKDLLTSAKAKLFLFMNKKKKRKEKKIVANA